MTRYRMNIIAPEAVDANPVNATTILRAGTIIAVEFALLAGCTVGAGDVAAVINEIKINTVVPAALTGLPDSSNGIIAGAIAVAGSTATDLTPIPTITTVACSVPVAMGQTIYWMTNSLNEATAPTICGFVCLLVRD